MTGFLRARGLFSLQSVLRFAWHIPSAGWLAPCFLAAALCAGGAAPAGVPEPAPQPASERTPGAAPLPRGIRVVELNGTISQKTVAGLREAFVSADPARLPAGAVLIVDSPGGDGLAAIDIGRMVRAARAHVFVRGRCASACVYVLAGGVVRGVARDGAIGIHTPRLTTFVKGIGVVGVDTGSNANAAAVLEAGNRRSRAYLADMGIPETLFAEMLKTPPDQTRYLDRADLPPLGLAGFDPAYLATHAPQAARAYGVTEEEYVRRTLATPALCLAGKPGGPEFLACYRRVLRAGE